MNREENIATKAKELVIKYFDKSGDCALSTFLAIVDAFRLDGVELFTQKEEEKISKGVAVLEGGTAGEGFGTCGACISACFIIAYVSGVETKEIFEHPHHRHHVAKNAIKYITSKFMKEWASICCIDIRYRRGGRAYSFTNPDSMEEARRFKIANPELCGAATTHSVPAMAVGWAIEGVCDIMGIKQ